MSSLQTKVSATATVAAQVITKFTIMIDRCKYNYNYNYEYFSSYF